MKKVFALVLALLMALPLFVACQQPTGPVGADTTTGTPDSGENTPPVGGNVDTVPEPDIPEGAKHWHGAQKDSWFQHIATHVATGGKESNEWLEAVSDEEYGKLE